MVKEMILKTRSKRRHIILVLSLVLKQLMDYYYDYDYFYYYYCAD